MRYFTLLIFTVMTISGCFQDSEDTTEIIVKPVPSVTIASANVVVKVQNEFGQPMAGLTARFNKITKVVENASIFHFNGEKTAKENELLTVSTSQGKSYEFNLYNIENQVNYHQITLFSTVQQTNFSSRESHFLPLPSNSFELQFTPQVYQSGTLDYAGEIVAEFLDYDMDNPIHRQALPGGNILVDQGVKKMIQFKKAFHIHLTTPDEKSLTWKEPHLGLFSNAFPSQTFLLVYDPISHQWKKSSDLSQKKEIQILTSGTYAVATLGNYHVVNGTWTVNNTPLRGHSMQVTSGDFSTRIHSTNTGYWEVPVPANENINIQALFNCLPDVQIQVNTLGVKSETGIKNFTSSEISTIEARGRLIDCSHQPVDNGFLLVETVGGNVAMYLQQAEFDVKIPACSGPDWTVSVKNGNINSTAIKVFRPNFNLGNVYVCENMMEEYIALETGEGYANLVQSIQYEDDGQEMIMQMDNAPRQFYVRLKHFGSEGVVANENANIIWKDPEFPSAGIEIECPTSSTCGFENIELTQYSQDQWVRGSFSGRFWTKTYDPLTAKYQNVHVDFQLKKQ